MNQAPRYLIIGSGRVAYHFQHYLSLLQLAYTVWQRKDSLTKLKQQAADATHILLLISDHAILDFTHQHLQNTNNSRIHFSGSLVTDQLWGAHPLMTFSNNLYDLKQYQSIPFIIDHDAPEFTQLLPGLPNPHKRLHKSLKAKYHAYCVLSGNFSCFLWQKFFSSLENEFNFPAAIAYPYFTQQMKNLMQNYKTALTGPLVRADQKTIAQNLSALEADPFQDVYKSFVACFEKINEEEKGS